MNHVRDIGFDGTVHDEETRTNGEVRHRKKVARGHKNEDSPMIDGFPIFHNFIREHEGLDGKTPAKAAGIKVEGPNKWLTLIQNAAKNNNIDRQR